MKQSNVSASASASASVTVLSGIQIDQKINRIARQILENYHDSGEVLLVGVANRGFKLAERIYDVLSKISDNKYQVASLTINKDEPLSEACVLSIEEERINGKVVILIDDVLNSGRTLIYACSYLLKFEPVRMKTVVLVDRRHRKFPIRADFVGLTLSTTLEEHISVDLDKNQVVLI